MSEHPDLKSLVVYESFFGNTERIARAVAEGLELEGLSATVVDAESAGTDDLDGYDLVVVGGPTHAFALSRASSREEAVARGGSARFASRGLREWLGDVPARPGTHLAATFDTRVGRVRHFPASAAVSAAHLLKRRHYTVLAKPAGFIVQDTEGPLESREVERAVLWARSLGRRAQARVAADPETGRKSGS